MKKTFKKAERLHKKKLIEELFSKGSYFYLPPFKVYYSVSSEVETNQMLVSVPKKIFKKAVERNKLKRRTREAYRNHKHLLLNNNKFLIGYIYTAKKLVTYDPIERAVLSSIQKLVRESINE
ncbi:ribonuclease P protein component [Fulvivirga lutea]|uniref:Ribonuclease P protein component n=1 Tax=Fulvivirga lutea TaxID=2810512 RepID=A0A975A113_9BACT|nr:ribonuclease P protein component [Fulvivirga lutea]QSE97944.1 ribonuclease P protein component [Fulvivirga lutea]